MSSPISPGGPGTGPVSRKNTRGDLKRSFTGVLPTMASRWTPPQASFPLWQKWTTPEDNSVDAIQKSFCFHVVKTLVSFGRSRANNP